MMEVREFTENEEKINIKEGLKGFFKELFGNNESKTNENELKAHQESEYIKNIIKNMNTYPTGKIKVSKRETIARTDNTKIPDVGDKKDKKRNIVKEERE